MSTYLKAFETFEQNGFSKDPSWLKSIRRQAIDSFERLGFPTMRDEYWKYTNVTPIAQTEFQLVPEASSLKPDQIEPFLFGSPNWPRLVFVNGHFSKDLSQVKKISGLALMNLNEALVKNPEAAKPHLSQYADTKRNTFTALNTAFFHDGAYLHVSKKTVLEEPILLLFISTSSDAKLPLNQVRNLIVLDEGSKASVIRKIYFLKRK